jgi:hypothetical protein
MNRNLQQDAALCFLVARPYFGRWWRWPGRHAWNLVRRGGAMLPILPRFAGRSDFHLGLQAAIASIRRYAPRVPTVLLLTTESIAPPPGVDRVIPIDPIPFEDAARCNFSIGGLSTYFKLSLFGIEGWKRIIYIDTDTIALGDLSELWNLERFADQAIYAVRETAEMGPWRGALGKLNTGVMVVNAPMLDRRVYEEMLALTRTERSYDGGDQGIINSFLASHRADIGVGELPEEYNVFVNDRIENRWPKIADSAKVLHFVGNTKPWSHYYQRACPFGREFKRRWDEAARHAIQDSPKAGVCSTSAPEI